MFQFVPRKVDQKTSKPSASSSSTFALPVSSPAGLPAPELSPGTKDKGKRTETAIQDGDLAAILWLSISDYSLWAHVDLRRAVATADDGWIPLSYLLQQSAYIRHLSSRPPDAAFVRAVRGADSPLEVRMLVTSPSKAPWYGKESTKDEQGGYEVRRRDWNEALVRVRNSTRNGWSARTVYMESIPVSNRTVPGIYHFASSLLRSSGSAPRVQSITLPPHHLDRPGDVPKCKGFALVILADSADMSRMVSEWPWSPRRSSVPANSDPSCGAPHDPVKFGFRTITKARWDELKEEYLTYRQRLLDQVAGATPSVDTSEETRAVAEPDDTIAEAPASMNALPSIPSLDPSAPFPPGCLVFVRNVHPGTNRTTLKALFTAHAFGGAPSPSPVSALDYVDYSKGMTSCHLRLSTSDHANTFVAAFRSRPLVQRTGLDNAGTAPSDVDPKPIEAEVVDGEREALYWDKVPEKVRREAVRKAVAGAEGDRGEGEGDGDGDGGGGGEDTTTSRRPRKRRRKA